MVEIEELKERVLALELLARDLGITDEQMAESRERAKRLLREQESFVDTWIKPYQK